jgi:hypothetical protein
MAQIVGLGKSHPSLTHLKKRVDRVSVPGWLLQYQTACARNGLKQQFEQRESHPRNQRQSGRRGERTRPQRFGHVTYLCTLTAMP